MLYSTEPRAPAQILTYYLEKPKSIRRPSHVGKLGRGPIKYGSSCDGGIKLGNICSLNLGTEMSIPVFRWVISGLFFFIFVFSTHILIQLVEDKICQYLDSWISGVGSDRATPLPMSIPICPTIVRLAMSII